MSEAGKIPARRDVAPEDTWALEDLYADAQAWEADCEKARQAAQEAAAMQGRLSESADNLLRFCRLEERLSCLLSDICGYAARYHDQDVAEAFGVSMSAKASRLRVECGSLTSFFDPEILAVPEETMKRFYEENSGLLVYRRRLEELRRRKEHVLSPELEKLLTDSVEMAQAPYTVFSALNDADLRFEPVTNAAGETLEVTNGTFLTLLQSPERQVRRDAFLSLYQGYERVIHASAALLNAQVNQMKFYAKSCKYASTLEASLDADNVPVSVYRNLIDAVHADIGYLHRYMRLRKKRMGVGELHMYDLYTPLVPEADVKVPYEKAKEEVLAAMSVLGETYTDILREGFSNRWIDVYENRGKRSGAYSAGQRVHPYVLLNYKDTLDSMFTLAHEMGHALHSWFSHKNQPHVDSDYVIFVAEVASTCNEALLMRYLLKKTQDKRTRAYLINYFLEQFRTTLYRQTMFAEFEMQINAASERGECLTVELLNQMYRELNLFYYGPEVTVDPQIDMEWARIPHFYYDFYVFQYATGFSAAMALAERILEQGEPAVKDYLAFLSGGCSRDPISLLIGAGVDMRTAAPVHEALSLFGRLLDEMEALTEM